MVAGTIFDFKEYVASRRALIEQRLASYLAQDDPPELWESMRYSVLSGGKRMRALLCLAAAESVVASQVGGGASPFLDQVLPCACAIELIHTFSLIHDDLPAMDNDDFRRGRPTNHKVFGEARAILAGDALFALAMEILLTRTPAQVDRSVLLSVAAELTRATGAHGMVGGQILDMHYTGLAGNSQRLADAEQLEAMHRRKTGALISFSTWAGACLAGAASQTLDCLSRFGEILGLAFQITDDLLDVTGDIKTLGKTPGKDIAADKVTWVSLFGVDSSRAQLSVLEKEARGLLSKTALKQESLPALESLLDYAIHRVN